ncbi:MAG: hypothetical protein LBD48_13440 [Treponema sp.]|jgi:hypothetical protein|nr:hypothetical protein [Treponema sp.]
MMKKLGLSLLVLLLILTAGCTSTNYSANMSGVSDYSTVVVKDYTAMGIVTVHATEIHSAGPLGFVKTVEGSKVTYSALMQEAARLGADDIINVRIDMTASYRTTAFDWISGWTRTYTYTGTALAIKYSEKLETQYGDPQLGGIPKAPEKTKAVRNNKGGVPALR